MSPSAERAPLPVSRLVKAFRLGSMGLSFTLMLLASLIILLILAIILGLIFYNGLGGISWTFLSEPPTNGLEGGGIWPCIFGTVALVLIMTIAALPVGVITAIYLQEYTLPTSRSARLVRLAVNNLAGVPSVVFGLFGVGFFIQFLGKGIDQAFYDGQLTFAQPAILWAALTLALLTLPVVIVTTEEALRSVPQELRDASMALGATRLQTLLNVVLPQSLPGILTGAILAVSRGAGEVAPLMLTGAAYYLPYLPSKLNDQFMQLGYHIYILATQSPNVEATLPILYSTVLVLLVLTFLLNLSAVWLRSYTRARLRGT